MYIFTIKDLCFVVTPGGSALSNCSWRCSRDHLDAEGWTWVDGVQGKKRKCLLDLLLLKTCLAPLSPGILLVGSRGHLPNLQQGRKDSFSRSSGMELRSGEA